MFCSLLQLPELHFYDGGPLTVQYLLVVDALNFCFWPDGELEYEHLAGGIKVGDYRDSKHLQMFTKYK
jgi:hypothetical protein